MYIYAFDGEVVANGGFGRILSMQTLRKVCCFAVFDRHRPIPDVAVTADSNVIGNMGCSKALILDFGTYYAIDV